MADGTVDSVSVEDESCIAVKPQLEDFASSDSQKQNFFPTKSSALLPFIGCIVLLLLPGFQLATLLILFQGISVVPSGVAFLVIVSLVAVRARKCQRGVQVVALIYIFVTTCLFLTAIIDFVRPWWGKNTDKDLVVMGSLSQTTVAFNVFSSDFDKEAFYVEYKPTENEQAWLSSTQTVLGAENSYMGLVKLSNLSPGVEYSYNVKFLPDSDGPSGTFSTLPNATSGPNSKVVFASTSCTQRNRVVGGISLTGFSRMEKAAANSGGLDFLMFLGDFIYTDVPLGMAYSGFGFGTDSELYGNEYRGTLQEASDFLKSTPSFFQYDDHEIINDYTEGNETDIFKASMENWIRHVGGVNPAGLESGQAGYHYTFSAGGSEFFMIDTRYNRDQTKGVIIGSQQLAQIKQWLLDSEASNTTNFKFLVSPVGWSRNHPSQDANWNCGCANCKSLEELSPSEALSCPSERDDLLDFIVDNNLTGVVLVSGDTHKPGMYELAPGVIEVSASPLHAIGPPKWNGVKDRTIYEEDKVSTAFALYELQGSTLTVKMYSGGVHINETGSLIIFLTLFFGWTIALTALNYYQVELKPSFLQNRIVILGVSFLFLVGIVVTGFFMSSGYVDTAFESPKFVYEFNL